MKQNAALSLMAGLVLAWTVPGDVRAADDLSKEVDTAIANFKKVDSSLTKFFQSAAGYAVFPKVAKGGAGIGAAHGNGQVFAKGARIGEASLTQVTLGLQLGGQVYAEVVFFENEQTLEDFKASKMKLSAQVSAVAAADGVAENAKYQLGVAVFTMAINGLMFEASVGGQKFNFRPTQK